MPATLVNFEDGVVVEVETAVGGATAMAGGVGFFKEKIASVSGILVDICRPVAAALKQIAGETKYDHSEVEVGFAFSTSGNIYLAKAKAEANLKVKLVFRRDSHEAGCKAENKSES